MRPHSMPAVAGLLLVLVAACGTEAGSKPGESRRTIQVVAGEQACSPSSIPVQVGERVAFEVRNNAKGDREFEGIEGTKIDEVEVPAGKTRVINYTVQETTKSLKVKCYSAGGPTTIIELVPGAAPKSTAGAGY